MITLDEARGRARAFYERHSRDVAFTRFAELGGVPTSADATAEVFSCALHPPTEKMVLADAHAARAWVQSWRASDVSGQVEWVDRSWPSVGRQRVPQKLAITGMDSIALFARSTRAWKILLDRTTQLAQCWLHGWNHQCPASTTEVMLPGLKRAAVNYPNLNEDDWSILLHVLDWLVSHQNVSCYVRELPIRGIDTKWIEKHRSIVTTLFTALTGTNATHLQLRAPAQIRVRFLDDALAPGGIRDLSASPEELDRYQGAPQLALISENLISVMVLPPAKGVIALHGGGYGVSDLARIGWLSRVPVLYWGDLDSHGFAILDQWRHHHQQTTSLMMDQQTLDAHRDLCVEELQPSTAEFTHLTSAEQATLRHLSESGIPLRLEQERIEWEYAQDKIKHAIARLSA